MRRVLFQAADVDDVDELVALRDRIARWLLGRGIQQWLPGEFPAPQMRPWVERGDVFVHRRDGRVVAAVAVLDDDPDIWGDDHESAGYIHVLMVDRANNGLGLGDAAMAHAEEELRSRGRSVARLDAVASNDFLRRWYEDRGYTVVGTQAFEEPELFDSVLLEKQLA